MAFRSAILAVLLAATGQAFPNGHIYEKRGLGYDYVIVGGGNAGLVIANRLSANPNIQVAVIEAGTDYKISNPLLSATPAGDVIGCGSSESPNPFVDWGFKTTPMPGTNGRRVNYARGKTLGGTTARNFMIYQRGTIGSYQQWADAVDDQSYTWDNLQDLFKATATFTTPNTAYRAANASAEYNAAAFDNSKSGPLQVSYANYASPFSSYIEGALNEIGIPQAQDFNSGSLMGAQYCASTIRPENQNRDTSYTSFAAAAQGRSNLAIFSNTLAKRITFSGKKANGVRVTTLGFPYTLTARKEVIISAGAFQSPQLLMVSGIGPADQLAANRITPVKVLPGVGQNMLDHVFAGPSYRVKVDTFTKLANNPFSIVQQFFSDYQKGRGVLTNPVCDFLGWEKVPDSLRDNLPQSVKDSLDQFPEDWPEIEYISAPGYVGDFASLLGTQPKDGYQYATILGTLVAPQSRGNVTIKSADTSDLPIINPNWLDHPADQAIMVAAYKRVRQAFASKAMSEVLADPVEYFPGPQVQTDAEILNTIKNTVMTVWHASTTCKMGKASDPSAVVDSKFKVFGVTSLRIADASVFPLLPPGHPQSTVYLVAEKISQLILSGQ